MATVFNTGNRSIARACRLAPMMAFTAALAPLSIAAANAGVGIAQFGAD